MALTLLMIWWLSIVPRATYAAVVVPAQQSSSLLARRRQLHIRGGSATVEGLKASLASALAAGCSKTLLAPFDTIKTVQQHYRSTGAALSLSEAAKLIFARPNGFLEFYVSCLEKTLIFCFIKAASLTGY